MAGCAEGSAAYFAAQCENEAGSYQFYEEQGDEFRAAASEG